MIRTYSLVVMDKKDEIIDRQNLDLVTNPTGTGFELSFATISGDIEDIITKVTQVKAKINLQISHIKDGYNQANALAAWIQKYSTADSRMFLEYNDTKIVRYCGGKVTKLTRTEKNEYKELAQQLEFTMTTPFFQKKSNTIKIEMSEAGKSYPYQYPYQYGTNLVENNTIENPYILEVPLIITINGALTNPTIDLLDENKNRYTRVRFEGITLAEGEQLVINSAQKKIYKVNIDNDGNEIKGTEIDFRPEVDPLHDTYLLAKRGTSSINVNTADSGAGFKLTGGWRQYTL